MTSETLARPVQQINNAVREPLWKPQSIPLRKDTLDALEDFCAKNSYSKREMIDVALRDYLKLPEPTDE